LTAIYDEKSGKSFSVVRIDEFDSDALTTHKEGEVILSGKTSIGYTGFENKDGISALSFGYPYREAPKTYIRKLTLAPSVEAYQFLKKGESITLTWEVSERNVNDFSECVKQIWEYSYDLYKPEPVNTPYSDEKMKEVLSNFFVESYVDDTPTKYYSGVELRTATCENLDVAEVGFVGRTLLNAFNALEYGESQNRKDLVDNANSIFDSYLQNGFSSRGFFNEVVHFKRNFVETNLSIRRQSEGVYAVLYYLNYEKQHGRKHPEWEKRLKTMLDAFLKLQNPDGSFPRKFKDDFSLVDKSGGSTPSATLPLVMGYKYFKDKRYLEAAKRSVGYLEKELISKADYFSSTLDANCEDKEASLYASTAAYYLALALGFHDLINGTAVKAAPTPPTATVDQRNCRRVKASTETQAPQFIRIKTLEDLKTRLAAAHGKPVLLDLYADWCVACKEFEHKTFSDPDVRARFDDMVLLQADVTANDDADVELLNGLNVLGLPTLIFFDSAGNEISGQRVTGFMGPEEFAGHLDRVIDAN
jgi:thiol-disulfide isomerase/thioredoxin